MTIFQSFENALPEEFVKRTSSLRDIRLVRGARALVVDDNEINLQLLRELLEDEEVHVDLAVDGAEAVARVQDAKTPYDIVLMDLQMPVMDGFEATRRIRERWPASELPVVAITADVVGDVRERALEAGIDDYLSKPISPMALLGMLVRYIRRDGESPDLPAEPRSPRETSPALEQSAATLKIPGVDTAAGLARWADKVQLYRTMLGRFAAEHADQSRSIRRLAEAGELDEAMRVAHRLKGIAGNLAVTGVYETVTRVHEALRNGLPDEALLDELEQQSELAVTAIREAGCTVAPIDDTEEGKSPPVSERDEVTLLLIDLVDLDEALLQDDAAALQLVQILQHPLAASGLLDEAQELLRLVLGYDYDGGRMVLARISSILLASRQKASKRDK